MDKDSKKSDKSLIKDFETKKDASSFSPKMIAIALIIIAFGIGTGYIFNQRSNPSLSAAPANSTSVQSGQSFGNNDTSTFKDTAEGQLQDGGIEGEGQYHLVRPGGDSQSVYLTSSIVDLSLFKGKKIKVWGQTQQAQHAGWLMDVGKVQVL
jgi:hypothetical protein